MQSKPPAMGHDSIDPATNEISGAVVDAAILIHQRLGPGLLESAYRAALAHVLVRRGLEVAMEVPIDIQFEDLTLPRAFRADLIVGGKVLVEVKAVDQLHRAHFSQVQTYLRFTGHRVGLRLNFDAPVMKLGIRRIVL